MTNIVYRAIGTNVMALDLDAPDSEPKFVEGNERSRAFDSLQPTSALRLCKCIHGCEKFFTAMFPATLCASCENSMRAASTK